MANLGSNLSYPDPIRPRSFFPVRQLKGEFDELVDKPVRDKCDAVGGDECPEDRHRKQQREVEQVHVAQLLRHVVQDDVGKFVGEHDAELMGAQLNAL